MDTPSAPALHPVHLPVGSTVGSWRLVARAGCGVHGVVYRALRVGQQQAQPVALKFALGPEDPRMAREAELLSRTRHPSISRLVDHGQWKFATGAHHPYIVMEWVDGVPLYEWAQQHAPSPSRVLRMLAQLAGALHELHSHGGLHRDVKGANILVRHSDGRAVLTDFGTGTYPGAAALTPPSFLPSTPAYRSPEAAVLELNALQDSSARHVAQPADDLYALGVTFCRLLTGEYPEPADPIQDEQGHWSLQSVMVPPQLLALEPRLRAFIQRLLSVRPAQRGTAAQLARELEQAATVASAPAGWLALAATAVLALAAWAGWATPRERVEPLPIAKRQAASADERDGGTAGLGEAASTTTLEALPSWLFQEGMAEDTLPEPVPGQARPDAKGRCPHKGQVVLNEVCWARLNVDREKCEELTGQLIKATCYVPVFPSGRRQPTSVPTHKQ